MNNEYMLYYICAMHTFFTWMVYLCCSNPNPDPNP